MLCCLLQIFNSGFGKRHLRHAQRRSLQKCLVLLMISICKIANWWLNIFSNEKVRWKKYCARGKAGRRQPNCRGFYLFFADILAVFVSPLAVCCWCGGTFVVFCSTNYNARVRGTRTQLTRSGDMPQGDQHKFSFYSNSSNILSNYSEMTLQTHEKK